jgi:hypothetical protein
LESIEALRDSMKIKISVGGVTLDARLRDTETAEEIARILPFEGPFKPWGDEFYFSVPVDRGLDSTATTKVEVGDIGYWPNGKALAIFFGKTPMSTETDPVPASEVNLVGHILGDATRLRSVRKEKKIRIGAAES